MSTRTSQGKVISKAEYKMLLQCVNSAISNLETVLASDEYADHHVQEWLSERLERWQRLKEKIQAKLL